MESLQSASWTLFIVLYYTAIAYALSMGVVMVLRIPEIRAVVISAYQYLLLRRIALNLRALMYTLGVLLDDDPPRDLPWYGAGSVHPRYRSTRSSAAYVPRTLRVRLALLGLLLSLVAAFVSAVYGGAESPGGRGSETGRRNFP